MKDSKEKWIGSIPDNWDVKRGKNILALLERPVLETDGVITCFRDGEVTLRSNRREEGFTFSLQEVGYQGIEVGDLVVHGMDGFAGAIGISDSRGKATPVLNVLDSAQDKKYLMYYLRCAAYCGLFLSLSTGIRVRSCDTNWNKLKNIIYLVPSLNEQRRIADFLDRRCAEIDGVIADTKKTIEEYKALKQSIITEAVTKGVRGARPMKDSGIEWIGEIPEEWRISRVGLHYDIILGKMLCSEQPSNDYTLERYYCAANVHFGGISDCTSLKEMWFSSAEKRMYEVKNGDLLVVEGGAGAGGSAIVANLAEKAFVQNSIMIVRSKADQDNRYLRYLIEHLVKQGYIDVVCNKATIPHFTKDKLATVPYPVLSIDEQRQVADYLDCICNRITDAIERKQVLLFELETYKKSVIYEYVTGKREVLS